MGRANELPARVCKRKLLHAFELRSRLSNVETETQYYSSFGFSCVKLPQVVETCLVLIFLRVAHVTNLQ